MLKRFWNWIKPTIEGEDGKVSHRRISILYSFGLLTFMLLKTATGSIFPEIAWIVIATLTGAFSGLSVWQTLANKKKDENNYEEEEYKRETRRKKINTDDVESF